MIRAKERNLSLSDRVNFSSKLGHLTGGGTHRSIVKRVGFKSDTLKKERGVNNAKRANATEVARAEKRVAVRLDYPHRVPSGSVRRRWIGRRQDRTTIGTQQIAGYGTRGPSARRSALDWLLRSHRDCRWRVFRLGAGHARITRRRAKQIRPSALALAHLIMGPCVLFQRPSPTSYSSFACLLFFRPKCYKLVIPCDQLSGDGQWRNVTRQTCSPSYCFLSLFERIGPSRRHQHVVNLNISRISVTSAALQRRIASDDFCERRLKNSDISPQLTFTLCSVRPVFNCVHTSAVIERYTVHGSLEDHSAVET